MESYTRPSEDGWVHIAHRIYRRAVVPGYSRHTLSTRQRDCLRLTWEGLTNTEIGKRLHISRSTVSRYLEIAYEHLGVHYSGDPRTLAAVKLWNREQRINQARERNEQNSSRETTIAQN